MHPGGAELPRVEPGWPPRGAWRHRDRAAAPPVETPNPYKSRHSRPDVWAYSAVLTPKPWEEKMCIWDLPLRVQGSNLL